jgi:hypothetical protein
MMIPPQLLQLEKSIATLLSVEKAHRDRATLLAQLVDYSHGIVERARSGPSAPNAYECAQALTWLKKPIFICGHHRSGTTLLQQLLDGHPSIAVLPSEGTYFTSFNYAARVNPTARDADRFVADWIGRMVDPNDEPHFKLGRSGASACPPLDFARRLLGWQATLVDACPELREFCLLFALIAAYRETVGTTKSPRMWVEKTPLNEHHVARFAKLNDARFIQMVRDPVATLASLAEIHRAGGDPQFCPATHAQRIGRSLALAIAHSKKHPDTYLVVRYEDLTGNPAAEARRIFAFLDAPIHLSFFTPTAGGRAVRSNSSFVREAAGTILSSRERPCRADLQYLISAHALAPTKALGYPIHELPLIDRYGARSRHFLASAARRAAATLREFRRVAGGIGP